MCKMAYANLECIDKKLNKVKLEMVDSFGIVYQIDVTKHIKLATGGKRCKDYPKMLECFGRYFERLGELDWRPDSDGNIKEPGELKYLFCKAAKAVGY